jgi:hypothetical protein
MNQELAALKRRVGALEDKFRRHFPELLGREDRTPTKLAPAARELGSTVRRGRRG